MVDSAFSRLRPASRPLARDAERPFAGPTGAGSTGKGAAHAGATAATANGASAGVAFGGDRLLLAAPARRRPKPLVPDGDLDYYQRRHADFAARHPDASPPSYYLGYGDVYVRRFTTELAPELSPQGQAWLVQARRNLQVAIESELARNPAIELDDAAFTAFAYATHSRAYLDAGLTSLPIDDLIRVAVTPNLRDTLNRQGLAVIAETAEAVARDKLAAALDAPALTVTEVLNALKISPDLARDVVRLLDTEDNSRLLSEGLTKLKDWPRDVALPVMDRVWQRMTDRMERTIEAFRQAREPLPAGA